MPVRAKSSDILCRDATTYSTTYYLSYHTNAQMRHLKSSGFLIKHIQILADQL